MATGFKIIFWLIAGLLYATGVVYVIFDRFVRLDGEFANHHPLQAPALHVHGAIGSCFLVVFGYLTATHILPGLRGRRRRLSGIILLLLISILSVSVIGLYYFADEHAKDLTAMIHTYLGLATVLPILIHLRTKA